jgi:hypothetical protein
MPDDERDSEPPTTSERPTHGQLLRVVHSWCCAHGAVLLGLGLENQDSVLYWRAEVRLASGLRVQALGADAGEVVRSLDLSLDVQVLN